MVGCRVETPAQDRPTVSRLPADSWVRSSLALGTLFLATSSVALATCVCDAQEDQMVVRRLDQARLDRALASHDPFKNAG